jgi:hypothetical protein
MRTRTRSLASDGYRCCRRHGSAWP